MSWEAGSKLSFSVSFYPFLLLLTVGHKVKDKAILEKVMYPESDQLDKHLDSSGLITD